MARTPKVPPAADPNPTEQANPAVEVLPREDKAIAFPLPQGTSVAAYTPTVVALNEMAAKIAGHTFDCTTPAGDTEARQTRKFFVELRTSLDKLRLEKKRPLLVEGKALDDEARKIETAILVMEGPIDAQIKAQEAVKNAEREQRETAERIRQAAIEAELEAVRMLPMTLIGKTGSDIQAAITRLEQQALGEGQPEEARERFERVGATALGALNTMLEQARQAEETKRQLDEQAQEVARQRDENEKREREAQVARDRAAAQDSLIAKLHQFPVGFIGASVERIRSGLAALDGQTPIAGTFDSEHLEAAGEAHRDAKAKLVEMLGAAETAEADAARRAEEETARRLADQRRARVSDMQANLQAVPMRAITSSAEAIADMAADLRGAIFTSEEAEDCERLTALRDSVLQQLQALHEAALATEQEKAERTRQEADAAQQREQERKDAEDQAIATATLYDAATDAALLLQESGHGDSIITRKLVAALERNSTETVANG